MNKKISILGCCVLRDSLGMQENDGDYIVEKYVQIPSPISVMTSSPLLGKIEIEDQIFDTKSKFLARCQVLELRKEVFQYILPFGGECSDYFLMDAAEFRKDLYYFPDCDTYFTVSHKDLFQKYIDKGILPNNYIIIDPLNIDRKILNDLLAKYCDEILKRYNPEKIILQEIKPIEYYVKNDDYVGYCGDTYIYKAYLERVNYCFSFFKWYLRGCNVIPFPEYVVGDTQHKWGKGMLHYTKEYYDYAYNCINIITSDNIGKREKEQLVVSEKKKYEDIMSKQMKKYLQQTVRTDNRCRVTLAKYKRYTDIFIKMLSPEYAHVLKKFINKYKIKKCSLIGRTLIAEVLINYFCYNGIEILFLYENTNKEYFKSIKICSRDNKCLLEEELIIVCDLNYEETVNNVISQGYQGNIYTIEDIMTSM